MSTKAFFINSTQAQYTDEEFSWLQKLFIEQGILADTSDVLGLAVSQHAGGANMSVDVAIGNAIINFTKNAVTWKILGMSNAIANLAIASNSSGSNRIDAIIIRASITTEPNSLKNNVITIEVVQGTGVSALSDGAITSAIGGDMFIRLANITVANGASSIVTGNIADVRVKAKTNDAIKISPSKIAFIVVASDPSGTELVEGLLWYNSTSHVLKYYDGTTKIAIAPATYTGSDGISINGSNVVSVDSTVVRTSGDQTIGGVKTHTSIPVLPASDPTTANQAVRKAYIDGLMSVSAQQTVTLEGSKSLRYRKLGKFYFGFFFNNDGGAYRYQVGSNSSATVVASHARIATLLGVTKASDYYTDMISGDGGQDWGYYNGSSWTTGSGDAYYSTGFLAS